VASGSVTVTLGSTGVYKMSVTLGSTGVYKMCHSTMSNPTEEHHFTIVPGASLHAHQAGLPCHCLRSPPAAASRRRMRCEHARWPNLRILHDLSVWCCWVRLYLVPICGYGIWYFNLLE